jgi:hypothetical protein
MLLFYFISNIWNEESDMAAKVIPQMHPLFKEYSRYVHMQWNLHIFPGTKPQKSVYESKEIVVKTLGSRIAKAFFLESIRNAEISLNLEEDRRE